MSDDTWKNVFRDFFCNCFAMQRKSKQHLRRELQPHPCRLRLSRLSTSLVSTNHAETEMHLLLPAIISISHLQSAYRHFWQILNFCNSKSSLGNITAWLNLGANQSCLGCFAFEPICSPQRKLSHCHALLRPPAKPSSLVTRTPAMDLFETMSQ